MCHVAAMLVPKDLIFVRKHHRKAVAEGLIPVAKNNPTFMKRIITGDEVWVWEYGMKTSQQSSEWCLKNELKRKIPSQSCSKVMALLTIFFTFQGIVYFEFVPLGQTINKEHYLFILKLLKDAIPPKRPELSSRNSWR